MVATILIAVGGWACVRTGGFTNDFKHDLHWRWSQTPEERLLAQATNEPVTLAAAPAAAPATPAVTPAAPKETPAKVAPAAPKQTTAVTETSPDWPGFRGPHRDGIIPGVRIVTDWSAL